MNQEIKMMFKKVITYNIIFSFLISIGFLFLYPKYTIFFLVGSVISLLNFSLNTFLVNGTLSRNNSRRSFLLLVGMLRILIVCIGAVKVIKLNVFNIIPYIAGYSSQLFGILIYGVTINNKS